MVEKQDEELMKPLNVKEGGGSTSPVSHAQNTAGSTTSQQFKALLLVLMVLQNSSTVLVGRHTRSSVKEEDLYSVNHLILTCEALKVRCDFFNNKKIAHTCANYILKTS